MIEIFTQTAELASKRGELLAQKQKAKELNDKIESDIEELEAKIEEVERIRLGEFFGIPKEEMFKEVRQHGRREIIGYHQLTSIHCKKLIDNEGGTGYEFSTTRSGFYDTADGKISIYSGSRPKKGTYSYKGVYVELGIWQAPNGLWFGDCCGVHAKDSGHGLHSVAIDDVSVAFQTQKEVLHHCFRRAIERLTYKFIYKEPEEIEERCPDCTAWAQKHLQLTLFGPTLVGSADSEFGKYPTLFPSSLRSSKSWEVGPLLPQFLPNSLQSLDLHLTDFETTPLP